MSDTTVYYRFLVRGGTSANLATVNEIPLERELIVATDTLTLKLGNGSTPYNDLPFISTGGGSGGNTVLTTIGVPGPTFGTDGDYAIDPAASIIYGPKAAGAWPAGVSLKGADGANGTTLRSGTVAPTGAIGIDGDFYINTATSFLYGPKAAGAWPAGVSLKGAKGDKGDAGIQGPAGPGVLSGTGVPSDSLGIDGQFFISTDDYLIYGPKAAGVWPLPGVALKGPKGDKGDAGEDAPSVTRQVANVSTILHSVQTGVVTLGKNFRVLRVASAQACRFRLYTSAAARDADVSRPVNQFPSTTSGLVGEWAFDANTVTSIDCAPITQGASMESTPSSDIAYTINPAPAGTTTVTLTYQSVEP